MVQFMRQGESCINDGPKCTPYYVRKLLTGINAFAMNEKRKASSFCHVHSSLCTPLLCYFYICPNNHLSHFAVPTGNACFCCHRWYMPASNKAAEPIKMLQSKYSTRGVVGAEELQNFMVEVQKETMTSREEARAIIDSQGDFRHLNLFQKGPIFPSEPSQFLSSFVSNSCYCQKKIVIYILMLLF